MGDAPRIIVLNGGSSSGKTSIARHLQLLLPEPWLAWSIDDLVAALPPSLSPDLGGGDGSGLAFGPEGEVDVGPAFSAAQHAWLTGLAAMARAGMRVILDDVFLGGGSSQEHLGGDGVLWAGVRCAPDIAARREAARGDRVAGMAATQAHIVHEGVVYDVEVDSGTDDVPTCARAIAAAAAR